MGVGSAVDHIAGDIGKESGQSAEQDADCKSNIEIFCCSVGLHHSGSGNDYDMMAAKKVMSHGSECQAKGGHAENQLGIAAAKSFDGYSCVNSAHIDAAHHKAVSHADQQSGGKGFSFADEFRSCSQFAAEQETDQDGREEYGKSGGIGNQTGRNGSGKEVSRHQFFEQKTDDTENTAHQQYTRLI